MRSFQGLRTSSKPFWKPRATERDSGPHLLVRRCPGPDRRGQPLGSPLPAAEGVRDGERVVMFDLMLGSLAAGDYVIQLSVGQGDAAERHLVPFRLR